MTEGTPLLLEWFQFCRLFQDSYAYSAIFEVKGIRCSIAKSSSQLAIYLLTKYVILFCSHYHVEIDFETLLHLLDRFNTILWYKCPYCWFQRWRLPTVHVIWLLLCNTSIVYKWLDSKVHIWMMIQYYTPMLLNKRKEGYSENRLKLENGGLVLAPTNLSISVIITTT